MDYKGNKVVELILGDHGKKKCSHEAEPSCSSCSSSSCQEPSLYAGLLSNCRHNYLASDFFVTSCRHSACKSCLKSHVGFVVQNSMMTLEPSYEGIRTQLLCPDERCGMELTEADLTNLLDIDTVKSYEKWLTTAYRGLYSGVSSATTNVIRCIKCSQLMAMKCTWISSTEIRGFRAKNNGDVNRFLSVVSNESIECKDSWACINCEFSWCAACGFAFESLRRCKDIHICREATNYRINDMVAEIESIYKEYTTEVIESGSKSGIKPSIKSTAGGIKYEYQANTSFTDKGASSSTPNYFGNQSGSSTMLANAYYQPFSDSKGYIENAMETVWGAGTGFGGDYGEDRSNEGKIRKVEKELDCRAENVLKSLTEVLQKIAANQVQPMLGFSVYVLLNQEKVLSKLLHHLMMNDSLMDICARSELYFQLAELLKTMAQYPQLLIMLVGSCFQTDRKKVSHVLHGNIGGDTSVIQKMKSIYEQSKIIVSRFKDRKSFEAVEIDLCMARCLLECYETLAIAAEKQTSHTPSVPQEIYSKKREDGEAISDQTPSVSGEQGFINVEDNEDNSEHSMNVSLYKESLKPLQFGECPFIGTDSQFHTFTKHFDESGLNPKSIDNTGVHNKKRMMHIAKEIASLATNLPLEWESSIHVRVDPVRMDLLKALIVGPKGTPYQNGIFIFDIYLAEEYPQVPPRVNFLTTGKGKVQFNPNLYSNGRVCLSLLGTWKGPSWQPWKSTLLQVLVSLQSLVFVADPFYNEPGYELLMKQHAHRAEEENRGHRYNTLQIAILSALRNPDSSFKDVIMKHFLHKKDEIIDQCKEWITASGGSEHHLYNNLVSTANEVTSELSNVKPV